MSWVTRLIREPTLYWKPPATDAFGNFEWQYPYQIKCRWEYRNESLQSSSGEDTISKATVYTDALIRVGGYMWRGLIIDVANEYTPPLGETSYSQVSNATKTIYEDEYVSQYAYALRVTEVNRMSLLTDNAIFIYKVYLT